MRSSTGRALPAEPLHNCTPRSALACQGTALRRQRPWNTIQPPWSRGFSSPSTDRLGSGELLCVSGADSKGYGNELKLKELFPGEEVSCSQSPPAETAVGRSTQSTADPAAGAKEPIITSSYWGQLLSHPEGTGHHEQCTSPAFPPQKCLWANGFCEILFSYAEPTYLSMVLASNFSEFNQTLMTLQITQGKKLQFPLRHQPLPPHPCNFRKRKELGTNISGLCLRFPSGLRTLWCKALLQIPLCQREPKRDLQNKLSPKPKEILKANYHSLLRHTLSLIWW